MAGAAFCSVKPTGVCYGTHSPKHTLLSNFAGICDLQIDYISHQKFIFKFFKNNCVFIWKFSIYLFIFVSFPAAAVRAGMHGC